jgi:hypothetical protein
MPQISKEDVAKTFKSYGIDLSPAEVDIFAGSDSGPSLAQAMANFANTKSQQLKLEASNPLKTFLEEEKQRRVQYQSQAEILYKQLQDTISAAPKLFGGLTSEQVQQYIAPIAQATREGSANLEGNFARRGIAGSSIEANALADAQRKYQENVLNTGLNVGMNTQQAQASAIQNRINKLFGQTSQSTGLLGSGAEKLTSDMYSNMNTLTTLPYFLKAMQQQEALFNKQMEGPGLWDKIDRGINTASNVGKLYATSGASGIFQSAPPRQASEWQGQI